MSKKQIKITEKQVSIEKHVGKYIHSSVNERHTEQQVEKGSSKIAKAQHNTPQNALIM